MLQHHAPWFLVQLNQFGDWVMPGLWRRGLFRREYAGPTLRDQFGIAACR